MAERDVGSARRRRERRLRSWLRHERMTVRMELAAALHHSSFRGAGPETYDAPRSQMTANSREDSVYFDLFDEDTEGARPDRLVGVRPQERDQRRTVVQIVDTTLIVPSLDVPVPQMDNQLVEVCRQLDVRIPEQVIEVPKISSPSRHCRRRVRFVEQLAEQLVEVPTIISYSSLRGIVEQNVDIPVLGRGGRNVGLQGFPPRQSSTAQLASQERSSERIVEQIVDSRVLGGGLQDFRPVQGSSASSSRSREHAGEGVFLTFPRVKKSPKLGSHSGSELLPESSPSTLAAHVDALRRQPARVLPSTSNFPLTMAGPQGGSGLRPQERDKRHTGVGYEIAQNLVVPVLQMGEQLPEHRPVLRRFQLPVVCRAGYRSAEDLPKQDSAALGGTHLRQPQMVEQLVHVPTVVSYSSLQQLTARADR